MKEKSTIDLRLYTTWAQMKSRCDNPKATYYENYGGRGISYSKKWKYYINFYKDMKDGFKEGLTLDRKNNNGNYTKKNCKWSTKKEQGNNTSRNVKITYRNETKNMCEWSEHTGIKPTTLWMRLFCYNWGVEKTLNTPVRSYKNKQHDIIKVTTTK